MIDRANKSVVGVPENGELKLRCLVRSSRPPAEIVWYRERTKIREGASDKFFISTFILFGVVSFNYLYEAVK